MKRFMLVLFIAVISLAPPLNTAKAAAPPPVSISFQVFYDQLSPYGTWINNSSYGYVWVPGMGANFIPYASGGHWEYTNDFGWMWVSDYAWGWAPFHYGNWFYDDIYGWMWVPGYNWAGAWVTWGTYDGYYGWAPLGPGYTFASAYRPPARYWNFVPYGHIYDRNVYNYRSHNTVIINNVTVINNTKVYNNQTFYAGPRREDVERNSGHRIAALAVAETDKPGASRVENNRVAIYRPAVNKESGSGRAAPSRVASRESLKPVGANSPNSPQRGAVNRNPNEAGEKISNDRGKPEQRRSEPVRQGTPRQAPTERAIPQQQQPTLNPAQRRGSERQMQRSDPTREPQRINTQPQPERPVQQQRQIERQQPQAVPQNRGARPRQQEMQRQPEMRQEPMRQQQQMQRQPEMQRRPEMRSQPQMQPRQQPMPQGGGGGPRQAAPQRGGPRR